MEVPINTYRGCLCFSSVSSHSYLYRYTHLAVTTAPCVQLSVCLFLVQGSLAQCTHRIQWNLVNMSGGGGSKIVHIKRNFNSISTGLGVLMPGDLKVVHIKQVLHINCVRINKDPLYNNK